MEIAPGIHWIEGTKANCYLLTDRELTLIDAGMSRNPKKILAYLSKLKYQPSDLKTVIITHAHPDHTGGLAQLTRLTGAKVAIHSADADYLSGTRKFPYPKGGIGILFRILSFFMKAKPVRPDIILNENDTISGLTVIHTRAHAWKHCTV